MDLNIGETQGFALIFRAKSTTLTQDVVGQQVNDFIKVTGQVTWATVQQTRVPYVPLRHPGFFDPWNGVWNNPHTTGYFNPQKSLGTTKVFFFTTHPWLWEKKLWGSKDH